MIKIKDFTLDDIVENESFFSEFNGTFSDNTDVTCKDLAFSFIHDTDTEQNVTVLFESYMASDYGSPNCLEINLGEYIQKFMELALDKETANMTISDFVNWVMCNFVPFSIKLVVTKGFKKVTSREGYVFNSSNLKHPVFPKPVVDQLITIYNLYHEEISVEDNEIVGQHSVGYVKEDNVFVMSVEKFLS